MDLNTAIERLDVFVKMNAQPIAAIGTVITILLASSRFMQEEPYITGIICIGLSLLVLWACVEIADEAVADDES